MRSTKIPNPTMGVLKEKERRRFETQRHKEGNVKTETEVMHLHVKKHQEFLASTRS